MGQHAVDWTEHAQLVAGLECGPRAEWVGYGTHAKGFEGFGLVCLGQRADDTHHKGLGLHPRNDKCEVRHCVIGRKGILFHRILHDGTL